MMKELSREFNRFLMDLDNAKNSREEFETINSLIEFATQEKYKMCRDENGKSYFCLACDEMMNDIGRYLERYRQNNELPGKEHYQIKVIPSSNGLKLSVNVKNNSAIKVTHLQNCIRSFPRYTLFLILGLDLILGSEFIKFNRYLIKEEYEKFLELRTTNPDYFIPYINHILNEMNNMKLI